MFVSVIVVLSLQDLEEIKITQKNRLYIQNKPSLQTKWPTVT